MPAPCSLQGHKGPGGDSGGPAGGEKRKAGRSCRLSCGDLLSARRARTGRRPAGAAPLVPSGAAVGNVRVVGARTAGERAQE